MYEGHVPGGRSTATVWKWFLDGAGAHPGATPGQVTVTPVGERSPVNLTPLTACLWTAGGTRRTRAENLHTTTVLGHRGAFGLQGSLCGSPYNIK